MFELMSKVKVDASEGNTAIYEFDKSWTIWKFYHQQQATNDMKSAAEKYIKRQV
jgi:hypothetical protein